MARIFILGSGFSASCGLPTQRNLFSDLLQDHDGDSGEDIDLVRKALDMFYPDLKSGYDGHPPFEEFFSLVHVSSDFESKTRKEFRQTLAMLPKGQSGHIRNSCLRLLRECLLRKSEEHWRNCDPDDCAMHQFALKLKGGDVILTFNWDALLEQHLQKTGKVFCYLSSSTGLTLLKLHGSLSWVMQLKSQQFQRDQNTWKSLGDDRLYALRPEQLSELRTCLGNRLPYIVPPTLFKRPTRVTESPGKEAWCLARMWEQAYQRVGEAMSDAAANEVWVIGYSLPLEDYHARILLRVGIGCCSSEKAQIHLIDPDPVSVGRLRTIVGGHITYHRNKFTGKEIQ